MKTINRIIAFLTVSVMVLCLCSCSDSGDNNKRKVNYSKLKAGMGVKSGVVTENDGFTLSWDSERACIYLTDKASGDVWSTIPYDYYESGEASGRANIMMSSPIMLEYVNTGNKSAVKSVNGYTGILKNGKIGCKKIENGIKVYYFFDKLELVVPVDYTLKDNGIEISVTPKEIIETDNLVYKISFAPFLCSAKNSSDNQQQYIVVPSGSGALMYTDERQGSLDLREYSENVYGNDPARYESEKLSNTQTVRMPVFGAKDGDSAILGIISEGAASASVDAIVGDAKIGWSAVYPTFTVRGSNVSAVDFTGGSSVVETISEELTGYDKLSVGYYPLGGEDADYSGMAEFYRDYLKKSAGKKSENIKEKSLTLNVLGGLQIKSLMLGIPYRKTVSATTYGEALEIIKDVEKAADMPIDVVMSGFGASGLDIGKLAGGFSLSSVFGNKKSLKALQKYCSDNKIPLFADFDIVRFNSSAKGFSKTFDAAKSSNSFTAYQYHYSVSLRDTNSELERFVLLNRASLSEAADKVFDYAEDIGFNALGLSTLGNIAYSDYDAQESFVRGKTESDVAKILKNADKKGLSVAVGEANDYAAVNADKIFEAPVTSSMYDILDADIPFYQMVFKGMTDVSAESINIAANTRERFLKTLEGGSAMSFTLCARYDSDFAYSQHSALAVSVADDNIGLISSLAQESRDFYEAVRSAEIKEHIILSKTLRCTVFDNGVTLWVNYSDKAADTSHGTVEANSFMFRRDAQ